MYLNIGWGQFYALSLVGYLHPMIGLGASLGGLVIELNRPSHFSVLDQQLQLIAELKDRCFESSHDRVGLEMRLSEVRKTLDAQTLLRKVTEQEQCSNTS